MGDGNHALATAKLCGDWIKTGLTAAEAENHPARFALAELVNIYDGGIGIEPIHRVITGSNVSGFGKFAEEFFGQIGEEGEARELTVGSANYEYKTAVTGLSVGQMIGASDMMIAEYLKEHGGAVDYIHDEETAVEMGRKPQSAFILLPAVEKQEIFEAVRSKELFPKKSFSIGSAREKRYYLECRRIR